MRVVIDTNVLMRGIELGHPQQPVADAALLALNARGDQLCITPQTLYEFWSVTTPSGPTKRARPEPGPGFD